MTEDELQELRRLGNRRPNSGLGAEDEATATATATETEGFHPRLVEFPAQPPIRPHVGVRMMLAEYIELADAGLIDGLVVVATTGTNWRYSAAGRHMEQDPTRLVGAVTLAVNQLSGFVNAAAQFEHRHEPVAETQEEGEDDDTEPV